MKFLKNQKGIAHLAALLVISAVAIGFVGWASYNAWQANKKEHETVPLPASSTEKTNNKTSEQSATGGNTGQIITGQIRKEASQIFFYFNVGAGFTRVWVEYGTHPDKLNVSTEKDSSELGMVRPDTYGAWTATIDPASLPVDDDGYYFYRAVGEYNGQTVYGGVTSFSHK